MPEVACEQDDVALANGSQDFPTQSLRVTMKENDDARKSAGYVADQFLALVSHKPLTSGECSNAPLADVTQTVFRNARIDLPSRQ